MIVWCKNRHMWAFETWGFAERQGWLPPATKRKSPTKKPYSFELILAGPDGKPLVTIRELCGLAYERARELAKANGETIPDPSDPNIALLSVTGPTSAHRTRTKDLATHLAKTMDGAMIDAPWAEQALESLKDEGNWVNLRWFRLWMTAFGVFFSLLGLLALGAAGTFLFDLVTGSQKATQYLHVTPGACLFLASSSAFLALVGARRLRHLRELEEYDFKPGGVDGLRLLFKGLGIWSWALASLLFALPIGAPREIALVLTLPSLGLLLLAGPDNTFLGWHNKPLHRAKHFLLLITFPSVAYLMVFVGYAQDLPRVERVLSPQRSSQSLGVTLPDGHILIVSEDNISDARQYTHLLSPEGKWLQSYKTPISPGSSLSFDPHRKFVWMTGHAKAKFVHYFSLSDRTWYEIAAPEGWSDHLIPTPKDVWIEHEDGLFVTVPEDKNDVWRKADPNALRTQEVQKLVDQGPLPSGFGAPPCDKPVHAAVKEAKAVVACRHEGLWLSENRGKTYRSLGLRSAEITYLKADFEKGEVLFTSQAALLFDGVFRIRI